MLQHWSLAHAIWHVTCPLALITWEVMGAKHDKVKKTQGLGQTRLRETNSSSTLVLLGNVMLGIQLSFSSYPPSTLGNQGEGTGYQT
jgi:hypothetical protein